MSSTPLGTRSLKMKIGETEYNADVTHVSIDSAAADSDLTTFADAASGGARQYTLTFTATQDPADDDSIWNHVWLHAGETIDVVVNPYGSATISATNPAFAGSVTITEPDGTLLGGDADKSTTARFTMDLGWVFTEKPTKVTTGTY